MITLEFSFAAALYFSITLVLFLVYWVFFEKDSGFSDRSASDRYVWQCSICTYFYIDSRHSAISVCPRCGSYNKKKTEGPKKEVGQ